MDVADTMLMEDGVEEVVIGDDHSVDNVDHSNHQYFSNHPNSNEMQQILTAAAGLVTLQQQEIRELVHT